MIDHNNKNFILAIVLSMAIIFGWQYFYAIPIAEQARQETTTAQPNTTTTTTTTAQVPGSPTAVTPVTRDQALAATPRLKIDTPELQGSINLTGAQLDDLHLTQYRETIDPKSPTIVLLAPAGTPNAFFAEQGFVGATGTTAKLPDSKTLWQAPADAVLSVGKPVTLTWDNGAGLVFTRQISIDDHFVFSVTQGVQNNSTAPVALIPYARVQRQDTPVIAGWWVFFEGMLGVLGDKLQEINYSDVQGVKEPTRVDSQGGWLGFTDKYWAAVMIPDQTRAISTTFQHQLQNGRDVYQTDYLAKDAIIIQPGAAGLYQDQLFAGAKVVETIQAIGEKYKITKFDLMIDWGWFEFITKPMFYLLDFLNSLIGNFGVAILIATVLVKLAVFPLANKSYASMSKMKKLQPEMAKLKELYPDDRTKQQQGMMELYKQRKSFAHFRLSAGGGADSGFLRALQGDPHLHRIAPRAVLRLDSRSFRRRPDQSLQSVWPHSLVAARHPDPRHLADPHGCHHVGADAPQPHAARSGAGQSVQLDAASCSPSCWEASRRDW